MSIEYNRWWILKNGCFHEEKDGETTEVTEDHIVFPGTTSSLDTEKLKDLTEEQIVDIILEQPGSWSIVYYNRRLGKVFVGRDIFGRQSLVLNPSAMMIGCRTKPGVDGNWLELPFGQVTVFDLKSDEPPEMYTYLEQYPQEMKEKYFNQIEVRPNFVNKKASLFNVSRATGGTPNIENAEKLFSIVTDATKFLLRSYDNTHVAVCLSGGVDSTFIAHVAHASVPSEMCIDLVNVAFGNGESDCEKAPDRGRARKALESLRIAYPTRTFCLILVNIDKETLEKHRIESVSAALAPSSSVLDDSLGCVLWFAVRGEGVNSATGEPVKTTASTCLLGSGADELLAGYARHRTRFEKERIPAAIAEECENELRRLGSRNGGRDARVAAQLGKTILSPLLEDSVVQWLNALPVDAKWDLSLPRGVGEKLLLREAVKMLGSPYDAPKQAMQFGSRMAKMSNNGDNSIKGSDKSPHSINL